MNGLLAPTKGKVFINGESIAKNITAARKKIGLVFQDADSQIVGQTAAEDVAFGPENLNLPRAEVERIVKESLQTVGLSEFSSQDPHKLSGGQKRKLALAGVLAMKPEVIMFDEPFSGLDYAGVLQVLAQLVQLHKEGHTIIVISHELEKVLAHADRLVIFHKGKLVEDGRPQEIISRAEQYGVRSPLKKDEDPGSLTWLR